MKFLLIVISGGDILIMIFTIKKKSSAMKFTKVNVCVLYMYISNTLPLIQSFHLDASYKFQLVRSSMNWNANPIVMKIKES